MTPIRALILAALALALWLTVGLASADEPTEPQTATRLHPGVNLIGWVGEPTPVAQLFREIPQLEAVWTWDAEFDEWIVAGRSMPEWLGRLRQVTAGMGLRMQLSGDAPVTWDRSTEPTRGLVKLRTGWNLVAWSGADGASIDNVAKGIGWSLRSIRRWNAATQQWATWTSPERSAQVIADTGGGEEPAPPGVRRGEALWVKVSRSVKWLQPTDILPRLVFPGGASQALQARVREDLEAVLAFYRDQYGIQADPSFTDYERGIRANPGFPVYVPKNVDALIQAYKDDGVEVDDAYDASIRAQWNRADGWAGWGIVVKQSFWPEDLSTFGRSALTHEYFHVLQSQLSDRRAAWLAATWLVEGTASWAEDEHRVTDDQQTWEEQREWRQSLITNSTPTLRSTEPGHARWEYTLGWLSTDLLTADTGQDSWIEFWRQLASTEIGPHGRWTSSPDWRTAFQNVFGMPVADFYVRFASWQREQAQRNPATTTDSDDDARWIRGRITREGGAPVAGVFVNAIRVEGETSVGWNRRAETDDDGAFAIRVFWEGDYRLSVDIEDDCTRYYSNGELFDEPEKARTVEFAGSDLRGVDIQLPPNVCGWRIRGRAVDSDGEPLVGVAVGACPIDGDHLCGRPSWRTASDGLFSIIADRRGDYDLTLDLVGGCSAYYRVGGLASSISERSLFSVTDANTSNLLMRVPEGMCAYQISGSIMTSDGQPLTDTRVSACRRVGDVCVDGAEGNTSHIGRFAITVPTEGTYRLSFSLEGCTVYFVGGGFTTDSQERSTVRVEGRDVRLNHLQIPAGMCAHQIKGSITTSDGQPLANTYVVVCREVDSYCVDRLVRKTDADGSFAATVSAEGRYLLSFDLEGCVIYFRRGGLTTTFSERSTVRIEGRSVRLNPRQIPAEMCVRISGRFVDAAGAALAWKRISAASPGSYNSVRTDANGRFEIRVPADGAYHFNIELQDQPYCRYDFAGQVFGSQDRPVQVSGSDVTGIELRLPDTIENLCE